MTPNCNASGTPGKRVRATTLTHLLRREALPRVAGREWFFCQDPDCDVVYFTADGETLSKDALTVRVGSKETGPPRPLCYCFGYDFEDVEREAAASEESAIAATITEQCRLGLARCEETNPQGGCCLGAVRRTFEDARRGLCRTTEAATEVGDCCASEPPEQGSTTTRSRSNLGAWAIGGATLSAMLSSACCWIPLLLLAIGASATGLSAWFEAYRTPLLLVSALLLAAGFYLVRFRRAPCEPGSACTVPNPKLTRFNVGMLWVATLLATAFAFFPNYVGALLGAHPGVWVDGATVRLDIQGMTCEACAVHVAESLRSVPGVLAAEVSYDEKRAFVTLDRSSPPGAGSLVQAIERAGYRATLIEEPSTDTGAFESQP